jgi:hypothetical protein
MRRDDDRDRPVNLLQTGNRPNLLSGDLRAYFRGMVVGDNRDLDSLVAAKAGQANALARRANNRNLTDAVDIEGRVVISQIVTQIRCVTRLV